LRVPLPPFFSKPYMGPCAFLFYVKLWYVSLFFSFVSYDPASPFQPCYAGRALVSPCTIGKTFLGPFGLQSPPDAFFFLPQVTFPFRFSPRAPIVPPRDYSLSTSPHPVFFCGPHKDPFPPFYSSLLFTCFVSCLLFQSFT